MNYIESAQPLPHHHPQARLPVNFYRFDDHSIETIEAKPPKG